jgi:hypothetical protein
MSPYEIMVAECRAVLARGDASVSGEEFREAINIIERLITLLDLCQGTLQRYQEHSEKLMAIVDRFDTLQEAVALGGPVHLQAHSQENFDKLKEEIALFLVKLLAGARERKVGDS